MIIDSPNDLKQWLTGYLPPLCDADPEVLAKYCLALVKKDRPDEELKASLIEQLDVFLKTNTACFVEKFLEVAHNKSYLSKEKSSSVKSMSGDDAPTKEISRPNSPVQLSTIEPPPSTEKPVAAATDSSSQPPLPPLPPPMQSIPYPPPETTPPYPPPKKEEFSAPVKTNKSEPKEREREERRSRRGSRPRDKSRSRSRDRERGRRSRSRGRSNRSKYDDRRRRSPHRGSTLKSRYNRRSRSRTRSPRWSRSPNNRRSRSPRDRRSRSRNRSRSLSPKKHQSRHKSRSRSPKPVGHAESPVSSSRKTPSKEDKEGSASPDPKSGDTKAPPPPLVLSVVSVPHQDQYTTSKSQRCRDYDEQGFCMKGDQCPFDHGTDPVVLEGGTIDFPPPLAGVPVSGIGYPLPGPLPRDIQGRGFLRHPPPPPRPAQFGEYTPNNPGLWGNEPMLPSNSFYGGRGRGMSGPPPRFPGPPPPLAPQDMGRELISVPVNGNNQLKTGIRASLAQRLGPASSGSTFASNGAFVSSQASHGAPKYPNSLENCTLELRKIPNGLNTISHLNQHFAKFGTITNIQVHHEGDSEGALVTFAAHSQANAAYRSTEAVLNNRFIKLFWHSTSKGEVPTSTTTNLQRSVHDRLGVVRNPNKSLNNKVQTMEAVSSENEKVIMTKGSLMKTVFNPSAIKPSFLPEAMEDAPSSVVMTTQHQPDKLVVKPSKLVPPDSTQQQLTNVEIKKQKIEAIRKQQELLKAEILAKQKVQKQKVEALKLKNEVESRTRQLLKEQMQHVKLLINKLEKNRSTMKAEEIKLLLNTIKTLQNAVETTKAQLSSSQTPAPQAAPFQPKTKAQLEKEILDTELELYTIQSDGGDITRIRTRLQLLKNHMLQIKGIKHLKPYSLVSTRVPVMAKHMGRGRGQIRGRGRGRGRPFGGSVNAVDRRSTCINASGFEREDKEEVLAHFAGLGTLTTYSWDNLTPAITVQYATRRDAEKALNEGRNLGDRLLTLTWVSEASAGISNQPLTPTTSAMPSVVDPGALQKTVVSSSAAPHSTSIVAQEDEEEITEEIVEEVETEEIGGYIFDEEIEEEEEEEENEEEGTRSWRR